MAVLLMTEPSGAMLPGKGDRAGQAALFRPGRREDHVVGVNSVALAEHFSQPLPPIGPLPPLEHVAQSLAGGRQSVKPQQAERAQMQHQLGHAAGEEKTDSRMSDGTVG